MYVQDVRYAAGAWMRRSGDVQDVRVENCSLHFRHFRRTAHSHPCDRSISTSMYVSLAVVAAGAWMRRSGDVQRDVRVENCSLHLCTGKYCMSQTQDA